MAGVTYTIDDAGPAVTYSLDDAKGSGSALVDAGSAGATGINRGALRLLGMPGDIAANVLDLGKAALGTPFLMAGKTPPDALQVQPRKNAPLTGDWLIDKASKAPPQLNTVNAINPEYDGGYIQNAGQAALGGMMRPQSLLQAANQTALSVAGGTAAKAVGDRYPDQPGLAVLASMSPLAAQRAGTAAVAAGIRGGATREAIAQRVQDLKNAGVQNPTLGLATGNPLIGGVENLLANTPGAVGIMRRAREGAVGGLQQTTQDAANAASQDRGSMAAGTAIQRGLNGPFRADTKATTNQLYDDLGNVIPPQTPVNVARTQATLAAVNPTIPGAPNLSPMFQNSRIMGIERALNADANPPAGAFTPSQIRTAMATNPTNLEDFNAALQATRTNLGTLPFTAVKQLRTAVGNEISDNNMMSDVPRSKWNPVYGALSEDIRGAAAQTGPAATQAFNRANNYNRAVIGRMEDVAPIADARTPETAFRMYSQAADANNGSMSTLQAVKKSLPADARGSAAGTVIEKLGVARNGVQDETGGVWSPETFLTNYSKMSPAARQELFSGFPNSAAVKAKVDDVAKATAMMRANSGMWANPSGTGANVAARGTLGAIGLGGAGALIGMVNPAVPLTAGGAVLGANLLARGLTSPKSVNLATSRNYLSPELLAGQLGSLQSTGLLGGMP